MSVRGLVPCVVLCGAWLASLAGQQPTRQLPPRFTAETELVTVDVSVIDRSGQPVERLSQRDFVVLENGRPQQIVAFQAITVSEGDDAPAAARRHRVISTNAEPSAASRTFVVVFDDLHLTDTQARSGRAAVEQFLRTGTAAGDRVILVATGSDIWSHARIPDGRDELLEIVKTLPGRYVVDSSSERISEWEAYRIEMHQDMDVALRVKRRFESYGAAGQVRPIAPIAREQIAKSSMEGIIDTVVRARASAVYNQALARNRATLGILTRALRAVTDVPGRKSVVLVSRGFVYEPELRDMRETVRASLRANAPIYFINARGLSALTDATDAAQVGPTEAQDTLLALTDAERESEGTEAIALDTGGFVVEHTNDLTRGFQQVSRESRSYYLLGYRPPDSKRDGRFRRIEVKLREARSGVTVKARRGYYAATDAPLESKSGEDPAIVSALDAPFEIGDVPLRTTAYAFEPSDAGVNVLVTTDVDVRQFSFTERQGRFENAMAYVIDVGERRTGQRYRYDEKVEMTLQPETRERLSRTWYSLSRRFTLPGGAYRARVVVRDLAGGRLGSVTHDFEVPGTSDLRMSTPILSDLAESDGTPASLKPVLVARRTFAVDSTLYCQYLVYGAMPDPATGLPRVIAGYELRRLDGASVASSSRDAVAPGTLFKRAEPTPITPSPSGMVRRLHGISLAGAPPGEYELILTITDDVAGQTLVQREALTIVPGM